MRHPMQLITEDHRRVIAQGADSASSRQGSAVAAMCAARE